MPTKNLPDNAQEIYLAPEKSEFSLYIDKAGFHKETGEMRFHAVGSDTLDDTYNDNMTAELFSDFLARIESKEPPPEGYGNEFWNGGIPYLSISHYPDLQGKAVPGEMTSVYMDGNRLKGHGRCYETPLGLSTFKSLCKDQTDEVDPNEKIRISIAFLDYKHRHKSNGFIFERKSLTDRCPECIKEYVTQSGAGKEFLRGHLIHWAFTRVPVNQRTPVELEEKSMSEILTQKDDAASIVGEELAEEIDAMKAEVGKSEAVVIKSEMEDEEEIEEEKKKKKDLPEEDKSVVSDDRLDRILSLLEQPEDELDKAYRAFRAALAQAETLEALQPAFEQFAEIIRGQYQETAANEPVTVSDPRMDVMMEKLSLLAEKVDLLTKSRTPVTETVPERRSITLDPNAILQQPRKPLSIDEIARKSVMGW